MAKRKTKKKGKASRRPKPSLSPKQRRIAEAERQLKAKQAELGKVEKDMAALQEEATERQQGGASGGIGNGWTVSAWDRYNSMGDEVRDPIRAEVMRLEGRIRAERNTPDLATVETALEHCRTKTPLGKAVCKAEADAARFRADAECQEDALAEVEAQLAAPAPVGNYFLGEGKDEERQAALEALQARRENLRKGASTARRELVAVELRLAELLPRLRVALAEILAQEARKLYDAYCGQLRAVQDPLQAAHEAVAKAHAPAAKAARIRREYDHLLGMIGREVGDIGPTEPMERAAREAHGLALAESYQAHETRWFLDVPCKGIGFLDRGRHLIAVPVKPKEPEAPAPKKAPAPAHPETPSTPGAPRLPDAPDLDEAPGFVDDLETTDERGEAAG